MDCPRCDESLETYSMGDLVAVSCPTCGYSDVPASHESESASAESWATALSRFAQDRQRE
jgi:DNA-directed RNA polymerase subunit M/transcription elongation factor TFIIS